MRQIKIQSLLVALLLISGIALAGHGDRHCCCPDCGYKVCVFEPEVKKQKKHCWEVECKDICIPKFKWPWECCSSPPACGKVRTIKVLKKKEYECEKCGYKWSVQTVCDEACGPGGNGACGHGACGNGPCTLGEIPNEVPAPPAAPMNALKPATQTRKSLPTVVPPVLVSDKSSSR